MKIPNTCKPDSATMFGYTGGMALYVANWSSLTKIYYINRRHKKRRITDLTVYSLSKYYPIKKKSN